MSDSCQNPLFVIQIDKYLGQPSPNSCTSHFSDPPRKAVRLFFGSPKRVHLTLSRAHVLAAPWKMGNIGCPRHPKSSSLREIFGARPADSENRNRTFMMLHDIVGTTLQNCLQFKCVFRPTSEYTHRSLETSVITALFSWPLGMLTAGHFSLDHAGSFCEIRPLKRRNRAAGAQWWFADPLEKRWACSGGWLQLSMTPWPVCNKNRMAIPLFRGFRTSFGVFDSWWKTQLIKHIWAHGCNLSNHCEQMLQSQPSSTTQDDSEESSLVHRQY